MISTTLTCENQKKHVLNFDQETGMIDIDNEYFAHTTDIVTEGPYFNVTKVLSENEKIELFVYYIQSSEEYPYKKLYHSVLFGGIDKYSFIVANDQFDHLTLQFYKKK